MGASGLFRPPRLRSRAGEREERHATWLELFYDLVFVAAVSQLAGCLSQDVSVAGTLRFAALFVPVWWAWVGQAFYATRFDPDDLTHRLLVFLQMFGVAALAANARQAFGATATGFALSYAAVRLVLIVQYGLAAVHVAETRPLTMRYVTGFSVSAAIWALSPLAPPPFRFWLWALGMVIDIGTPFTAGLLHVRYPPHVTHLPERFGLFTIIVLGEGVARVVQGAVNSPWNLGAGIMHVLAVGLAFAIWWLYFEGAGAAGERSVPMRTVGFYQSWLYAHLPLTMGIAACAVGMQVLIAEPPEAGGSGPGGRLLCLGCFLALAAMSVITRTSSAAPPHLTHCFSRLQIAGSALVLLLAGPAPSLPALPLLCSMTALFAGCVAAGWRLVRALEEVGSA